jgi:hypothetical protein
MSPRGMAFSNTRYLSSSETRVNAGIRGFKFHLSELTWCQESVGGICFTNKWRAASLQPLTFQTSAQTQYFQMHLLLWVNGSFFLGEHRGFLKEGVKIYRMAPMSPLNSPTFFFCLHIYSLWHRVDSYNICFLSSAVKHSSTR